MKPFLLSPTVTLVEYFCDILAKSRSLFKITFTLIVVLGSFFTYSQGSRVLAPNYGGTGSIGVPGPANDDFAWLEHDAFAATEFLDPSATSDERMYVHLRDGETLRYGIRRIPVRYQVGTAYNAATIEGDNQDVTIVIYDNAGTIVQATYYDTDATSAGDATLLTSNGSGTDGIIGSVAESLIGPEFTLNTITYNPGGYEPREYTNNTGSDQDFYIAFLQDEYTFTTEAQLIIDINGATIADVDIRSWYDLWDFTVYDQEVEQTGRLFCKRWGFTAQYFGNLYADEMEFFARIPSTVNGFAGNYIKKVDIGGIDPFSSTLFANSTGADLGSVTDINGDGNIDFLDARKSNADETIGALEYDIFLQNPDINVYPTSLLPTVVIADAVITCGSGGRGQASIYFETNQVGQISILVDLNGTAGYQDGTEDVIIEQEVSAVGAASVLWNGLDGLGDEVASGTTITISGRFTSGPLHIPMGDVEDSPTGINMEDVRPTTSFNLIYWDDESPAAITNASPTVNLSGSNTNRHVWTGDTGDGDLINTWSFGYYQINTQVIPFDYDCDSDGDGVTNDLDEDGDNDGISNTLEGDPDADADADGIPNYLDTDFAGFTDSNSDGVNDNFDPDLDGIINAYDLDSDNDGIPDVAENGLTDTDNDGQLDSFTDDNNNGLNDEDDPDPHTRIDLAPDECVFVDGGDHLLVFNTSTIDEVAPALGDVTLTFGLTGDYDNGTDESFTLTMTGEATTSIIDDGNLDGIYLDTDSNEGTYAQCDDTPMTFTITIPRADWNTHNDDGVVNITVDVNAAVGNFCTDNTASCISDVRVTYLLDNAGGTPLTLTDTDDDGVDDYLDLDSDNDGIVDVIEAGGTANTANGQIASFTDSNGNGWNDNEEIFALPLTDTDGHAVTLPNYRDIDSDDDGIVDNQEGQSSQSYTAPGSFTDTDGDGLNDTYDPNNGGTFISPVNSDGTGDADYISTDADGDGVDDVIEGFDTDLDGFGDWDATGSNNDISDETGYNVDADSDGLWDVFDTNGGGAAAGIANVTATNSVLQNTDNADNADWQDTDDDNDTILTSGEDDNGNGNFADDRTQGQSGGSSPPDYLFNGDYDGDGVTDVTDLDSDNDGILDVDEDGDTGVDPSADADGDGITNYRDSSLAGFTDVNTDGVDDRFDKDQDAVPDFLDLDSDNDGLFDAYEANNGVQPNNIDTNTGQFNLDDPDNDGLMNQVDGNTVAAGGTSNLPKADFDSDGLDDFEDLDSDNDGIVDNVEFQAEGGYISPTGIDSDGDGVDNAFDPNDGGTQLTAANTDGGGEPDYRDTDSDDDNVLDRVEGSDADNDGIGDWDDDMDGTTNEADYSTDGDSDGLVDAFDNVATIDDVTNITGSSAALQNTDGLDNRDWRDTNDDNDSDLTEDEDDNGNGDYSDDRTDGQGGGSSIPDYLFKGDTDGDAIADASDSDSDNDGIPDTSEGGTSGVDPSQDADVDGIPNYRDSDVAGFVDTNGDGVDDRADKDLDGIPDFQDLDSDNDGIPDAVEANNGSLPANMTSNGQYPASYVIVMANDPDGDGFPVDVDPDDGGTALANADHDSDGISDYLDLDSDNDGLPDIIEGGGSDSDGDGLVDNFVDANIDGLASIVDPNEGGTALTYPNSDTDTLSDYFDTESDGDGIADAIEQGGLDTDANGRLDNFVDTDSDGFSDVVDTDNGGTALDFNDADGDGLENYRDLDSDNDGLQDILEAGGTDSDDDGIVDGTFTDANSNGYDDSVEASPLAVLDTDGDGVDDFADLDSDNDGITDVVEFGGLTVDSGTGQIDSFTDTNTNGWNDAQEGASITPTNTDNATDPLGVDNHLDLDSDDDGIVDNFEAQTKAAYIAHSGNDTDNDGLDDAYDPDNMGTLITPVNTDGDLTPTPDYLDSDSDDDNVTDLVEGNNAGRGQYADWDSDADAVFDDTGFDADVDSDGILDIFDTVVGNAGNTQVTGSSAAVQDTDVDGTWDFQDTDDDGDGEVTYDNTAGDEDNDNDDDPTNDFADGGTPIPDYLFNDPDSDGDGITNSNDADADNDGLANAREDGGTGVDPGGDIDEDGILNYQDSDMDGDGTLNTLDSDVDGDSVLDTFTLTDTNGDGIFDQFDNDLDGIPDMIDRDSDNDGIADVIELGLTDADENGQIDGPTDGAITDTDGNGMEDTIESDPIVRVATVADDSQDVNDPSHTLAFSVSTTDTNGDVTLAFQLEGDYGGGTGAGEDFLLTGDGAINLGTFSETDSDLGDPYDDCGTTPMTFAITISQANWNTMNDDGTVSIVLTTPNNGVDTGVCTGFSSLITNISVTYNINNPGGTPITIPDTDSDGIANYLDLDSDNDGISDNREAQATASYTAPVDADADEDGILDVYDEDVSAGNALAPVNTDGDLTPTPDYLDSDSDDDGLDDIIEGHDADSNGFADWDTDGDNVITDETGYNTDFDQDGFWDIFDTDNSTGGIADVTGTNADFQDTDGDAESDFRDTDDDGDGINTLAEDNNTNSDYTDDFTQGGGTDPDYLFVPDQDGDTVLDDADGDSDNDGVPNTSEYATATYAVGSDVSGNAGTPFGDSDGDGIYNYLDASDVNFTLTDVNADGIDDRVDQDFDGVPNFFDLDSDNDGMLDAVEANNGVVPPADFNAATGRYTSGDGDGDGIVTTVDDSGEAGTALADEDFDSDGLNDYLDLDSDDDGISDNQEGQGETRIEPTGTDANGDGWDDAYDGGDSITPVNTDVAVPTFGDSEPDYRDLDSDADSASDRIEGHDANINGFADWDTGQDDNDYTMETGFNTDSDNDGIVDLFDDYTGFGLSNIDGTIATLGDTDSNGTRDWRDDDDDGDGVDTRTEDFNTNGVLYDDKNQGGGAGPDYLFFADKDADGVADNVDFDADNDGIPTSTEIGALQNPYNDGDSDGIPAFQDPSEPGFVDTNADGVDDRYDSELDGEADFLDIDSDNDGIPDALEANGGTRPTGMDSQGQYSAAYTTANDANTNGLVDDVEATQGGTPLAVPDSDGDSLSDYIDLDSDNDGIADIIEAAGIDADSDGIVDAFGDTDGDGLANAVDSDNGGTAYTIEDLDGDNLPNYIDADSDNDGLSDLYEAGGTDATNDGVADALTDTDTDGWVDTFDSDNGGTALTAPDTDSDGNEDYRDLDSDNDGIPDAVERNGGTLPANMTTDGEYTSAYVAVGSNDSDSDGLYNDTDGTTPSIASTDGDGIVDHRDLDSDSDGIPDILEVNGADSNNDAQVDSFVDTDGDGLADTFDLDNSGTGLTIANSDGDGTLPDYRDIDADDDGIPDIIEVNGADADDDGLPANPTTDTDGDGWADSFDSNNGGTALTVTDIDGDGLFGFQDLDADNDGLSDIVETDGTDANNDGLPASVTDTDGDGWPDSFDSDNGGTAYTYADTDGDGRNNFADLDSDNDGLPDAIEANAGVLPANMDSDGQFSTFNDTDGDGYANDNDSDNGGTALSDPDTDGAGDTIVDRLDLDSDNDGIPDAVEGNGGSLPANMDANGVYSTFNDSDFDGLHDDLDSDNSGTALANPNSDNGLTGGDTDQPDYIDLDADADGIVDIVEAGGTDSDQDGVIDSFTDTDGDGLGNTVDPNNGGTALPYTDTDLDGSPNYIDLDSDNDTVSDTIEAFDSNSNATTGGGTVDGVSGVTPADNDADGDGIDDNFEGAIPTFQNTDATGAVDWLDNDDDGDTIPTADENADVNPNNGTPDYLEATTNPCGGSSIQVYPATGDLTNNAGVTNPNNAAGAPDGSFAELYDNGDELEIDLQHFFGTGTGTYTITWRLRNGVTGTSTLQIDESDDDVSYTTSSTAPSTSDDTNFITSTFTPEVDTRYIRIIYDNAGGNDEFEIDAIGICSVDDDNDLVADRNDEDDDNDGVPDVSEITGFANDPSADDDIDGTLNYLDPDIAGYVDGNADNVNDNFDLDLDGIPNHLDLDSDNDGITDAVEANGGSLPANQTANGKYLSSYLVNNDTDGDGLANDVDTDNSGTALANPNTDGAGSADFLDIDSDDDGITDLVEAGGTDSDDDGVLDSTTDSNSDGLINLVDSNEGGAALTISNFDGDNLPNYRDVDSDNDAVGDIIEAGGVDSDGDGVVDTATDTDGDGWADTFDSDNSGTALTIVDTDGDGLNNHLELDSDNDGLPDALEGNGGTLPANMDADGQYPSTYVNANDTDGDGLANNVDTDNSGTALTVPNSDGIGGADYIDIDADNDGIPDITENSGADTNNNGTVDSLTDTDGDGIVDTYDPDNSGTALTIANADGDALPTYRDLDSDNDGIPDVVEMGGIDSDGDGLTDNSTDNDSDGWSNTYDSDNAGTAFSELDTDGDGFNNNEDLDTDNDGIADAYEGTGGTLPAGMDADGQYSSLTDTDGDGLHDNVDTDNGGTALAVANTDGSGNANFADTESDGDGDPDYVEGFDDDEDGEAHDDLDARAAAWETANGSPGQYPNTNSNAPNDEIADWLEDTDGDGVPNYLDHDNATYYLDTDNDGIIDLFDPDQNGVAYGAVSGQPDNNSNGTPNQYDVGDNVALPVELYFFGGEFSDGEVLLSWKTATELNNSHFDVERSFDGKNFSYIGRIDGNGTTSQTIEYSFVDSQPIEGANYYRLNQVDFDGANEYSQIIRVIVEGESSTLDVYPNPAQDYLVLRMNTNVTELAATLVDMNGGVLVRRTLNEAFRVNNLTLDVSILKEGIYFLIVSVNDEVQRHKIVIRR